MDSEDDFEREATVSEVQTQEATGSEVQTQVIEKQITLDIVEDSNDSVSSTVYPYPNLKPFHASPQITVAQRGPGNNKWDKTHACKFCEKKVTKMSTHLQRVHKREPEVIKVLMIKKGTIERRKAWGRLLNEGDYLHNFSVLKVGSGTLIPKYRSKMKKLDNFVTCPYCKAMYLRNLLPFHVSACKENPGGKKKKRGQSVREGTLLMPVPQKFSERFFRNVLQNMNQDDVLDLIKNDHLLILFGERLYYRRDVEEHTPGHISGRLRELGRLLKIVRQRSKMKVSTMKQVIHADNFDILIASVRELAEFDPARNQFKKGTLALKLGYSLKKCASILKAEAIQNSDSELKEQAQSFEDLIDGNWYDMVSATASQSVYRSRQNQPQLLPACEDIEKLHDLLNQKCKSKDYATLAKGTLCLISLFNRKRGGEVQRMKVADFEKGMTCGKPSNEDILQGLTESEKKLMNYFNRIEIRGKFNRTVPVLLTAQMVQCIKNVLHIRQNIVPPIESPYLFASLTGIRPYRGSDVIREFSQECDVKDPTIFTFTHLRKQVATLSQTMEISKWEQEQLAKFLGHDFRTHRKFYRQSSEVLDRAKVAKILLKVNTGINVSSITDLTIDENEELGENENNENNLNDNGNSSDQDLEEELISMGVEEHQRESGIEMADTDPRKVKGPGASKRVKKRKVWSEQEKAAVIRQLNFCIIMSRVPKKDEAEKAIANEPHLRGRTWRNVKDFLYNMVKKKRV